MNRWVPLKTRDKIVSFTQTHVEKTPLSAAEIIRQIGLFPSRFYQWKKRQGKPNKHNNQVPKKHWLLPSEQQAIVQYFTSHQREGYRRAAYMMLDENVVAASPSSVYRVLKKHELLNCKNNKESKKGTGFLQPSSPHEHWHIDISYINIAGTFYYFCSVLDGYSRYLVHWEIRESMKEMDVEIILERAHEKFPDAKPRIISDNGPQFIANEFKRYIKTMGMTHVRTSPYYPQSNGKIERFHQSLKVECIRPRTPVDIADARYVVGSYVDEYNTVRLHSAIGYIAPLAMLEGRSQAIASSRARKLKEARKRRGSKQALTAIALAA